MCAFKKPSGKALPRSRHNIFHLSGSNTFIALLATNLVNKSLFSLSLVRPKRIIVLFPGMRVMRKIFTRAAANLFF